MEREITNALAWGLTLVFFPESDEGWANYGVAFEVGRHNCFSESAKKAWRRICDQFQQPRVQLGIVNCYEFTSHISTNCPIDWPTGRSFCTADTGGGA